MQQRRWIIIACLFLIGATLVTYSDLRSHQFINFDDDVYVIRGYFKTSHLFLLTQLAEEIVVPAGVAKEIAQGPGDDRAREWLQAEGQTLVREVKVVPQ